jgi:hypothetical protein
MKHIDLKKAHPLVRPAMTTCSWCDEPLTWSGPPALVPVKFTPDRVSSDAEAGPFLGSN